MGVFVLSFLQRRLVFKTRKRRRKRRRFEVQVNAAMSFTL